MKLEKVTDDSGSTARRRYDDACGTALALEFLGERWSILVIRELTYGPRRFGEIRANLPGISANVLTQRLEAMETAGIVTRRRLGSPANVQVYELTPWGREAEPIIQVMGRWAARSRHHDPLAFMSTASAMQSLSTLVDRDRLAAMPAALVAFRFPDDAFVVRVADGTMTIERGEAAAADVVLTGDTMALRHSVYGKRGFDGDATLALAGDRGIADRFVDLFRLPEKIA